MSLKKLIVREFTVCEEDRDVLDIGAKYSYFYDPDTDKYYIPNSSFVVEGDDLSTKFEEVGQ